MYRSAFYFSLSLVLFVAMACASTSDSISIESAEVKRGNIIVKVDSYFSSFQQSEFKLNKGCLSCNEIKIAIYACSDANYTADECEATTATAVGSSDTVARLKLTPEEALVTGQTYFVSIGDEAVTLDPGALESTVTALLTAGLSSGVKKKTSAALYQFTQQ